MPEGTRVPQPSPAAGFHGLGYPFNQGATAGFCPSRPSARGAGELSLQERLTLVSEFSQIVVAGGRSIGQYNCRPLSLSSESKVCLLISLRY